MMTSPRRASLRERNGERGTAVMIGSPVFAVSDGTVPYA